MEENKFIYLTKQGLERIKKEQKVLKDLKMAKTKGESPEVLHSEDLNPEYLAFQEDLTFLETRLNEVDNILKNAKLIKIPPKQKQNTVQIGAHVRVEVDGRDDEFTIVGSLEANPGIGNISNESPVGIALLNHKAGDRISISSSEETIYKIKKIRYKTI